MADVELTAAQTRELRDLEQAINTLHDNLTRAERAGLDVAELRRRLTEANARRVGLLKEFTPGTSSPRRSR